MRHASARLLARLLVGSGTDRMVAFHRATHCPNCNRYTAGGPHAWRRQDLKQHQETSHKQT